MSQPETITLNVNDSGDGSTFVNHAFTRHSSETGHSVYIGENESYADNTIDRLELYFKPPKPSATYPGNCRPSLKRAKTITFGAESLLGLVVVRVDMSYPSGMSEADQIKVAEEVSAMCQNTSWLRALLDTGLV